jgi:hypothetical protein
MKKTVKTFSEIEAIILEKKGFSKTDVRNIKKAIESLYTNENTRSTYISKAKKMILAIEKKPSVRAYILSEMNFEGAQNIREKYTEKIERQITDLDSAKIISIETAEKHVKNAVQFIEKEDFADFYAVLNAVTILTGRRPSEILRGVWSFEKRQYHTYGIIKGASKKRTQEAEIEFPILYNVSNIKLAKAVENLQNSEIVKKHIDTAKIKYVSITDAYVLERQIRAEIEKNISDKISREFSYREFLQPKNARQLYGHYFAHKNASGFNVRFEGRLIGILNFFALILSHGKETKTAQSYFSGMQIN